MASKLTRLAERRAALVGKAAKQRMELSRAFTPLRGPMALADTAVSAARYIERHKTLVLGALALATALRPHVGLGLLRKGWAAWRIALAVRRYLRG